MLVYGKCTFYYLPQGWKPQTTSVFRTPLYLNRLSSTMLHTPTLHFAMLTKGNIFWESATFFYSLPSWSRANQVQWLGCLSVHMSFTFYLPLSLFTAHSELVWTLFHTQSKVLLPASLFITRSVFSLEVQQHIHKVWKRYTRNITISMELTVQKGKGNRGKKTSDCTRTRDLCSIAEFQPREPPRLVKFLRPPSLLCTDQRCATIQRHLRPAPRGWYCVLCDGSRLSTA